MPKALRCQPVIPGESGLAAKARCRPVSREIWAREVVPMGLKAFTDDTCPGPRDRGFHPLCWTSRAWVRVLAVSTSCPGRLASGSECLRVRPDVPGDLGPGPSARGVDQLSRLTRESVQGPRFRPDVPGNLAPCPRSRRVDQLSRTTQAHVRVLKVSTSCPSLLTIRSAGLRCHQLAWMTRACVRGPAGSTSCPG